MMYPMKIFPYLAEHEVLPSKQSLIIELGCGDGRVLVRFYDAGYSVIGVDKDQSAIETARLTMPKGMFHVGDIRGFPVPTGSFIIVRNVLPFLDSKQEASAFLAGLKGHPMHFTFFGMNDERPGNALWWTREEVKSICKGLNATVIEEFDGMSTNLAGKPRRSHIFYCLKL